MSGHQKTTVLGMTWRIRADESPRRRRRVLHHQTASARVWSRLGLCLLRENDNKFTEEIVGCFAHARALRPGVALHHARLGEVRLPPR